MICTTIQNKDLQGILDALESCEMAEIRLDRCALSNKDIDLAFSSDVPLVATCRIADVMQNDTFRAASESMRIQASLVAEKRLVRAIEAGASYVDVEIEAPKEMSKRVRQVAHDNGAVFIRSYHDFEGTASEEELLRMIERCRRHGADLVKIVTTAHSEEDVARVMGLYGKSGGKLIAFCMGEAGKQSRVDCLKHGAPYTYAALSADEAAAPGQWPMDKMKETVYGDFRFIEGSATVAMPASKSFAQRAIIAAALAGGESLLEGYSPCSDSEAAIRVAGELGAAIVREGEDSEGRCALRINGIGASLGSIEKEDIHVGESGLLTRLMIPLAAQLGKDSLHLSGEKTLLRRTLDGVPQMMQAFGAKVVSDGADCEETLAACHVPLTVSGPLECGKSTTISGKSGSQLISGLLMALPLAEKNSTVNVTSPKSIPYMFITLDVLKKFGIKVSNDMLGGRDFLESDGDWSLCTEMVFRVRGGQKYLPAKLRIEGDWSAAANFLVAGAIFGKLEIEGLDTTSLQADLSIMDILMAAGASLSQLDGNTGTICVQRSPIEAIDTDLNNCPDLFPIVAVLAAFCEGESRLAGIGRLAHKESDRAKAICDMLEQMGVEVSCEGDVMKIKGQSLPRRILTGNLLKGGRYTSSHDHRMVMALKVAELGADSKIEIDDEGCVAKSFPGFLDIFAKTAMR